jgi:hypothetical protein
MVWPRWLKDETDPYLSQPGRIDLGTDGTETPAPELDPGIFKSGRIREVEEFSPQLQFHVFPERDVLEKRKVDIANSRTPCIAGKPRRITGYLGFRCGKCRGIEINTLAVHYFLDAESAPRIPIDVGTLCSIRQGGISVTEI